jgi:hypothetical protein
VLPVTVVRVKLPTVIVAPGTKLLPELVIAREVEPKVTGVGLNEVMVGCGAETEKPSVNVAAIPPAMPGFVTVTSCAPGDSEVFGHQTRSVELVTHTNRVLALGNLQASQGPIIVLAVRTILTYIVVSRGTFCET